MLSYLIRVFNPLEVVRLRSMRELVVIKLKRFHLHALHCKEDDHESKSLHSSTGDAHVMCVTCVVWVGTYRQVYDAV